MVINCPSQNAQPLGGKLKGKIRISATNGSAMTSSSGLRREDPEQGNDEAHAEVRLHVLVRLVATDRTDHKIRQCSRRSILYIQLASRGLGNDVVCEIGLIGNIACRNHL